MLKHGLVLRGPVLVEPVREWFVSSIRRKPGWLCLKIGETVFWKISGSGRIGGGCCSVWKMEPD